LIFYVLFLANIVHGIIIVVIIVTPFLEEVNFGTRQLLGIVLSKLFYQAHIIWGIFFYTKNFAFFTPNFEIKKNIFWKKIVVKKLV